jgi:Purine nucleoside phosphorylase
MNLKLGIIGGSGLYDLEGLENKKVLSKIKNYFGETSGEIINGNLEGVEIFFLPRHGKNHSYSPSNVPYRANIDALKRLGCNDLISVSAVGSLKEGLPPGKFVLVDQFIDRTFDRKKTKFDNGIVAHVSMAKEVCKLTSELVYNAAKSGI